jgi:outer membrane protein assembly factor BamB
MRHLSRRRFLQSTAGSLVVLHAGCSAPSREPDRGLDTQPGWSTFRGDRYNTGYGENGTDVSEDPAVKWTFKAGDDFWGSPIVAGGRVYAGNGDSSLYAVDAETGDLEWKFRAGHRIEGTPAYADGVVYVGSYDRHVYALDAATGERQWELEMDGLIRSSPKVVDGDVYVGVGCHRLACKWYGDDVSQNGWMYTLDADTGDVNWQFETGTEVVSTPAVGDETIYVGCSDSNLYALDRSTGRERWHYEATDLIWSSPTLAFGTVYFCDWDSKVYAVDAASGEEAWTYNSFGSYISGSTAIDEEAVYFGHTPANAPPDPTRRNAEVFALDRETGEEQWAYLTDALEIGSSPAITDDMLYIGSHSQVDEGGTGIYALTKDGEHRWFFEVKERGVGTSPALLDGVLYFGAADDNLYALEPAGS